MKILKLVSENVKRLSAVDITPGDGALITIGGKNGAGKSSVLDSVAYALGGKELVPAEPIRKGESEAKIVVDLGEVVVTRKFKRDRLPCNCAASASDGPQKTSEDASLHAETCSWPKKLYGETVSTLTVTNKDGARYPSPQAMLDKLLGRLTFDPLAFAREAKDEPKRAADTLRRLTNLDFTPLDAKRKELFDQRAMANKSLKVIDAQIAAMSKHEGAPDAEIGADAVKKELEEADRLRTVANKAKNDHEVCLRNLASLTQVVASNRDLVDRLRKELDDTQNSLKLRETLLAQAETNSIAFGSAAVDAIKAVPDVAAINTRLEAIAATNRKVRENASRLEKVDRSVALAEEAEALTAQIDGLDNQKATTLASAPFPVPGLGLTDDGVTFGGVPLEQAASSEQLRVSVAIGLALNPSLKVLLVRNGNLLDDDGIQALGTMATEAGAQVWMEYVTSDAEGVTVMIEDGHIA